MTLSLNAIRFRLALGFAAIGLIGAIATACMAGIAHEGTSQAQIEMHGDTAAAYGFSNHIDSAADGAALGLGIFSGLALFSSAYLLNGLGKQYDAE